MLSVINKLFMLSGIMLSVVMLSVVMLNVVAPLMGLYPQPWARVEMEFSYKHAVFINYCCKKSYCTCFK
jgi:hypothetical protein